MAMTPGGDRKRLVEVQLGEGSVLVEAVVPPGREETSAPVDKVLEAFDTADRVISDLAVRLSNSVKDMATRAAHPGEVSLTFGLKFATTGSVIVASGTAEASLEVSITYRRDADCEQASDFPQSADSTQQGGVQ